MPIRCLIVDDEHFALALLEKYIRQLPELELVAACKSPVRAVELLQSESVDLLFSDIQMPVLSGLNLLRHVSQKPVTIFTTAYPQHAHEAFEVDAADYLLKPYTFERFERAVQKAAELLRLRRQEPGPDGHLTVKSDGCWVKIPLNAIRYIEGWREYVKIFTETEKIITLERLSNLEKQLPGHHFLRVHKSYIVASKRVSRLDGEHLVVGETRLPLARARRQQVIAALFR